MTKKCTLCKSSAMPGHALCKNHLRASDYDSGAVADALEAIVDVADTVVSSFDNSASDYSGGSDSGFSGGGGDFGGGGSSGDW